MLNDWSEWSVEQLLGSLKRFMSGANLAEARAELALRCRNCGQREEQHAADGKCLFDSTYYAARGNE